MRRVRTGMLIVVAAMLGAASALAPALAQSTSGTGLTLRQRLDNDRADSRRTLGERSLSRTNTDQEARRRLLIRQRNSGIDSRRSVPILPNTSRSSVVVTQ